MRKIAIIGATGMLGSAVYSALKDNFELLITYRNKQNLSLLYKKIGKGHRIKALPLDIQNIYREYVNSTGNGSGIKKTKLFLDILSEYDAIINCTGVIKPFVNTDPASTLFINGAFPNILSRDLKDKLLHVTTDCVFDGISGAPYTEKSTKNPNDLYGLSKSLGEPDDSLVLRTSFIGREIGKPSSLLEWVVSNKGKKIIGYENHLWNGITTKEFGKVCFKIISDRSKYPKNGIFHIFSNEISKYEILTKINEKYNLGAIIEKKKVQPIDRRLGTVFNLNKKLQIADFDTMLKEL
ncbi:MAG: sugar nucleotide-binding protein [Candidatus Levybacteria bacterium]|nr:sugar nucleotide-binding protein [Candidatus Levybacteria bacterium]